MSRRKKSAVAQALVDLRGRHHETQAEFAQVLRVVPATCAGWESTTPPKGIALAALAKCARERGHEDIAVVFDRELEKLQFTNVRAFRDINEERMRWVEVQSRISQIQLEAAGLITAGNPAGQKIADDIERVDWLLEAIQLWSWRNR